jgi:transcriptional regulator
MYDLPYFKEKDEKVILEFIKDNPFAFISGCDADNKPIATQIPVFLEQVGDRKVLRGHIMKNTDHHNAFVYNSNVLVVFTGQSTYVSATWYSNPHEASTWNYMSVQIKGVVRFLNDDGLIDVLKKTTLHFENNNPQSTTIYDNLSTEYTQKLMKAIVAFEIEVVELNNVFKLSQNRNFESFQNIITQLNKKGGGAKFIADEMEKRIQQLFPDQNK